MATSPDIRDAPIAARAHAPGDSTQIDIIKEVRFAVVMYGGVSLAIYINGVAQELLSLVRATAADPSDAQVAPRQPWLSEDELRGAERVYRDLARELSGPLRERLAPLFRPQATPSDVIHVAFVVDILSGTSAGGINAIFLAKALANAADLRHLRELWISQGDLALLLNDRCSEAGMPPDYRLAAKPTSVLNSQRMYFQLRSALDSMDGSARERDRTRPSTLDPAGCADASASPLAKEIDLYVTATDLCGIDRRLPLWDKVVYERSYRSRMHFLYADGSTTGGCRNDFSKVYNPMLALAARATSSVPLAFEPMMFKDLDQFESKRDRALDKRKDEWGAFFNYGRGSEDRNRPQRHSFGDGGYLDNKPFGYAIDALRWRHPDALVERKLIYVEPTPEHPELSPEMSARPNAFANLMLAGVTLPRAETIYEDLERVRDRNRLIERITRATRTIDFDVRASHPVEKEPEWVVVWKKLQRERPRTQGDQGPPAAHAGEEARSQGDVWARFWLSDLLKEYGPSFGPYHRLKVASLTSDMAELVTRVSGFDEESQELEAIRALVSAWRQLHYEPDLPADLQGDRDAKGLPLPLPPEADKPAKLSESRLLMDFDLAYRIRRVVFLRSRIDILLEGTRLARETAKLMLAVPQTGKEPTDVEVNAWLAEVLPALRATKQKLGKVLVELRRAGRELRSSDRSPLKPQLEKLGIRANDLHGLMQVQDVKKRIEKAQNLIDSPERRQAFEAAVDCLRQKLRAAFEDAAEACATALDSTKGETPGGEAGKQLLQYLSSRYDDYDRYDIVLFGFEYGTEFGEGQPAEPVRISPEDATTLLQERGPENAFRLAKLAGTYLGNFGGFLDPDWRRSDILWGRLDAADRIVHAVISGPETAKRYVLKAQAAILEQTFDGLEPDQAQRLLVQCAMRAKDESEGREQLRNMLNTLEPHMSTALRNKLPRDAVLSVHAEEYAKRGLNPERSLRLISRSTAIVGRLLAGLPRGPGNWNGTLGTYLLLAGRVLWGLVEVAVPGRFWRLTADWWWKLLYAFAVVMIALGMLPDGKPVRDLGILTLSVVLGLDLLRQALGLFLSGRKRLLRTLLIAAAVLALVAAGGWLGMHAEQWRSRHQAATWRSVGEAIVHVLRQWWQAMPVWGWIVLGIAVFVLGCAAGYRIAAHRLRTGAGGDDLGHADRAPSRRNRDGQTPGIAGSSDRKPGPAA